MAGIHSEVVLTEREGHARELVEGMPLAELRSLDGIVAVSSLFDPSYTPCDFEVPCTVLIAVNA